jgi:hypothetical protein
MCMYMYAGGQPGNPLWVFIKRNNHGISGEEVREGRRTAADYNHILDAIHTILTDPAGPASLSVPTLLRRSGFGSKSVFR